MLCKICNNEILELSPNSSICYDCFLEENAISNYDYDYDTYAISNGILDDSDNIDDNIHLKNNYYHDLENEILYVNKLLEEETEEIFKLEELEEYAEEILRLERFEEERNEELYDDFSNNYNYGDSYNYYD